MRRSVAGLIPGFRGGVSDEVIAGQRPLLGGKLGVDVPVDRSVAVGRVVLDGGGNARCGAGVRQLVDELDRAWPFDARFGQCRFDLANRLAARAAQVGAALVDPAEELKVDADTLVS